MTTPSGKATVIILRDRRDEADDALTRATFRLVEQHDKLGRWIDYHTNRNHTITGASVAAILRDIRAELAPIQSAVVKAQAMIRPPRNTG